MCEFIPAAECKCTDFVSQSYEHCHPIYCHNASICKLRRLLDEPMSANCYEQQIFYLVDYMKFCKHGFFLPDLVHLTRVLEILAQKLERHKLYKPYFKKLLDIASLPLFIHDVSEELKEAVYFSEYLSVLGLLTIWLTDVKLRVRIYKAILHLLSTEPETCPQIVKVSSRLAAVESSHLPEIVTQLVEISPKEEYMDVLTVTLRISQISLCICEKMIKVNAIDYLLLRLLPQRKKVGPDIIKNVTHSQDYLAIVDITCQVLINLIGCAKFMGEEILKKFAPSLESLWAIRYIFRGLLYGKYSQPNRNNVLQIILLCLDTFPYIPITECDLLDDLICLSFASENKYNTWVADIPFTNSFYDVYFKKMLIACLSFVTKYPHFALIYSSRNVIPGLLAIVSNDYVTDWQPDEHELLIEYTLTVLYYIAPELLDSFIENNGILTLLINIEMYLLVPNYCNKHKLESSLKILSKLVKTRNINVAKTIRNHSGIPVFILLCNNIIKKETLSSFDQDIFCYCFYILSYLNDQPTLNNHTIILLRDFFIRVIHPNLNDPCMNPNTIISAIDLLWEIIIIDDNKLGEFIKMEGIYLLLDIIDKCTFPIKVIGLGCLIDMCENGFSVPFLLTWRGGESKELILNSLLAKIFREECKRIGTRLDENDIILDVQYPLIGKLQYQEILTPTEDCRSSLALTDFLGSARPKVYALLQILNTKYEEKVELSNEHYKIANLSISRNDKIILHLAKNYFALKLSEAWHELFNDVINSFDELVNIDVDMLCILIDEMDLWSESIKKEQEAILQAEVKKEIYEEEKLYEIFKKCRIQDAIDAFREMQYFARTTEKMFRLAHKEKQITEINKFINFTEGIQRTYKMNFNITTPFHQKYDVEFNFDENMKIDSDSDITKYS